MKANPQSIEQILKETAEKYEHHQAASNQVDGNETNTSTDEPILGLPAIYNPSVTYPIRTARYWADIEFGKEAEINFYKLNENGAYEIHRNATAGFDKIVNRRTLHEVLKETAYECSLTGISDIALFTKDNKVVPMKIEKLRWQTDAERNITYYHGLVNIDLGTAPWILTKKFKYNKKGEVIVENVPYVGERSEGSTSLDWKEISINKFNKIYGTEWNKSVNLGKVSIPVVRFANTGFDRNGHAKNDWEEAIDSLIRMDNFQNGIDRSMRTAKTRLFQRTKTNVISLDPRTAGQDPTSRQIGEDAEVLKIEEDSRLEGDSTQIADRQLNVGEWQVSFDNEEQKYYNHTGENISENHKNNMHGAEINKKGDNKYRRATAKRTPRQFQIQEVVQKIIELSTVKLKQSYFSGVDKVVSVIQEVDIRKQFEVETKTQILYDMGVISQVQALMRIEDIDEATALMMLANKAKHDLIYPKDIPEKKEGSEKDDFNKNAKEVE